MASSFDRLRTIGSSATPLTLSLSKGAHAVNMTPEGAYQLRRHPEAGEFRKAWEAALALGVQQLEDLAPFRFAQQIGRSIYWGSRALHGQDVPVYSYGKLVGKRTIYDDRLLMFLLRNRAPTRFAADGRVTARRSSLNDPQDAARLSRLKRQWRKEWEEEAVAKRRKESEEAVHSLNAKLESMHLRIMGSMTKRTRALYDAWKAAEAEDERAGRTAWTEEMEEEQAAEDAEWELAVETLPKSVYP